MPQEQGGWQVAENQVPDHQVPVISHAAMIVSALFSDEGKGVRNFEEGIAPVAPRYSCEKNHFSSNVEDGFWGLTLEEDR